MKLKNFDHKGKLCEDIPHTCVMEFLSQNMKKSSGDNEMCPYPFFSV